MQERRLTYVILAIKSSTPAPSPKSNTTTKYKKTYKRGNFISFEPSVPLSFLNGSVGASKLQNPCNGLMIHWQ